MRMRVRSGKRDLKPGNHGKSNVSITYYSVDITPVRRSAGALAACGMNPSGWDAAQPAERTEAHATTGAPGTIGVKLDAIRKGQRVSNGVVRDWDAVVH